METDDGDRSDFSNYGQTQIHLDMIQDKSRTTAYYKAILDNKNNFKNKVVLDVGSGSGILSLFAAQAGAKKVYSVECTCIATVAEQIIKDNHFENVITILRGRLEDVTVPEKVDIIISEWMGYTLYFENMLPAVVMARDRYLKPGGALLPSGCRLFLSAVQSYEYRATQLDYWDSIYGFNMSAMKDLALKEPVIDTIDKWQLCANNVIISELDIHKCPLESSFFTSPFELKINTDTDVHALVTWFDVAFHDFPVKRFLSTSPQYKSTHWRQTYFYFDDPIAAKNGDKLHGTIEFAPNPKDDGGLLINVKCKLNDGPEIFQIFDLR